MNTENINTIILDEKKFNGIIKKAVKKQTRGVRIVIFALAISLSAMVSRISEIEKKLNDIYSEKVVEVK